MIPLKTRVALTLNGHAYAPGDWIELEDGQEERAAGLIAHGLVEQAPARPVRTRRAKPSIT